MDILGWISFSARYVFFFYNRFPVGGVARFTVPFFRPLGFCFPPFLFRVGFRSRRVLFRPFSGCEGFFFYPFGISFPFVPCLYFTSAQFHSGVGFFLDRIPAAKGFFSARSVGFFFLDRFPAAQDFFSARVGLLFRLFRVGISPLRGSIPCRLSFAQGSF